ncbi:hypothetical protein ACFLYB_05485 [Chloroflexota bacterium]
MPMQWNLLMFGTKVRVKGDKDIDGHIINWLADGKKEIVGYLIKSGDDPPTLIALAFDDKFEVLE